MNIITSTKNTQLVSDAKLQQKKYRDSEGLFIVEGEKLIQEGLCNAFQLERVYILEQKLESSKIVEWACQNNFDGIIQANEQCIERLADAKANQGVIGIFKKKTQHNECGNKVLILENVQDPSNIGALLRTASATNFCDIFLIDCADPYAPKCVRSSMSGLFKVNLHFATLEECLTMLESYQILCGDMDGQNIFDVKSFQDKVCIAVGNEGNGVSNLLREKSTKVVSIPMQNGMESLNVAFSAGMLMYEVVRKS